MSRWIFTWSFVPVLLLSGCTSTTPVVERLVSERMQPIYERYGYAPAVRVQGNTLVVSGIPAAGPGDCREQARRMLKSLDQQLDEAGFKRSDIVEIVTYHVAVDSAELTAGFECYLAEHKLWFAGRYPAWSAVGVTALLMPDAKMELRVMAVK